MSLTFEGTIITEVETIEAKNGNKGYKFGFRTKDKKGETINCCCWSSSKAGTYEHLTLDKELTIRGWYSTKKQMDIFVVVGETKEFVVTYFRGRDEQESLDVVADEIRACGGEAEYKAYQLDYIRKQKEVGYVRVPLVRDGGPVSNGINYWWVRIDDAIQINGRWCYWGDAVLDRLSKKQKEDFIEALRKHMSDIRNTNVTTSYKTWKQKCIDRIKELINGELKPALTIEHKIDEINI